MKLYIDDVPTPSALHPLDEYNETKSFQLNLEAHILLMQQPWNQLNIVIKSG